MLRARLAELDALRAKQQWRRLADDVATVEATIARARERAAELVEAADGLLARRDELRGRLEAYRAKAAGTGSMRTTCWSRCTSAPTTLLFTAPCDLPAATKAVFAYQQTLSLGQPPHRAR